MPFVLIIPIDSEEILMWDWFIGNFISLAFHAYVLHKKLSPYNSATTVVRTVSGVRDIFELHMDGTIILV